MGRNLSGKGRRLGDLPGRFTRKDGPFWRCAAAQPFRAVPGTTLKWCERTFSDDEDIPPPIRISIHKKGQPASIAEGILEHLDNRNVALTHLTVSPELRRKKIGTRIREEALRYACSVGKAFLSDESRSEFEQAFWEKQVDKGRASCAEPGKGFYYSAPKAYYEKLVEKGEMSQKEFDDLFNGLPKPIGTGDQQFWPCRRFAIKKPCDHQTLDGLGRFLRSYYVDPMIPARLERALGAAARKRRSKRKGKSKRRR